MHYMIYYTITKRKTWHIKKLFKRFTKLLKSTICFKNLKWKKKKRVTTYFSIIQNIGNKRNYYIMFFFFLRKCIIYDNFLNYKQKITWSETRISLYTTIISFTKNCPSEYVTTYKVYSFGIAFFFKQNLIVFGL